MPQARIVITEFMDERAVAALQARHDVLYDPGMVDDAPRLLREAAGCEAIVVRNRTQVRADLLAALERCRVVGRLASRRRSPEGRRGRTERRDEKGRT